MLKEMDEWCTVRAPLDSHGKSVSNRLALVVAQKVARFKITHGLPWAQSHAGAYILAQQECGTRYTAASTTEAGHDNESLLQLCALRDL
jgi:hypothetical protein